MSAFLLKAKYGSAYVPPGCTGVFSDVACPSLFANWIEELSTEGITGGCGVGIYCSGQPQHPRPDGRLPRQDVRARALRALSVGCPARGGWLRAGAFSRDGFAYDFGFQYVEALVASGITGGCGSGSYCPDNPVTRRQMAIFLAKALGLHWPY